MYHSTELLDRLVRPAEVCSSMLIRKAFDREGRLQLFEDMAAGRNWFAGEWFLKIGSSEMFLRLAFTLFYADHAEKLEKLQTIAMEEMAKLPRGSERREGFGRLLGLCRFWKIWDLNAHPKESLLTTWRAVGASVDFLTDEELNTLITDLLRIRPRSRF